jgi:hypothetical protein
MTVVSCSGAEGITVQMASEALLLLARSDVLAVAIDFRITEIKKVSGSPWASFTELNRLILFGNLKVTVPQHLPVALLLLARSDVFP